MPKIAGTVTIKWDGEVKGVLKIPDDSVLDKLKFQVGSRRRPHEIVIVFDPPMVPEE